MTKLDELKKKHAELKGQIREESKAFFKESSVKIFEKYPQIKSFAWRQYTPHFNDGDECVFSVHGDAEINGMDVYEREEESDVPEKAYVECENLINSIDSDTMKEMFGDHCKVVVTPKEIEVEEYQHD